MIYDWGGRKAYLSGHGGHDAFNFFAAEKVVGLVELMIVSLIFNGVALECGERTSWCSKCLIAKMWVGLVLRVILAAASPNDNPKEEGCRE